MCGIACKLVQGREFVVRLAMCAGALLFCYVMAWLARFSLFGVLPNHRLFHSILEKENFLDRSDSSKGSKKDSDWLIREIRR